MIRRGAGPAGTPDQLAPVEPARAGRARRTPAPRGCGAATSAASVLRERGRQPCVPGVTATQQGDHRADADLDDLRGHRARAQAQRDALVEGALPGSDPLDGAEADVLRLQAAAGTRRAHDRRLDQLVPGLRAELGPLERDDALGDRDGGGELDLRLEREERPARRGLRDAEVALVHGAEAGARRLVGVDRDHRPGRRSVRCTVIAARFGVPLGGVIAKAAPASTPRSTRVAAHCGGGAVHGVTSGALDPRSPGGRRVLARSASSSSKRASGSSRIAPRRSRSRARR